VQKTSDREVVVTRTFDAPARLVFEAWSNPELFKKWWVPRSMGMTLRSCEIDVRIGGKYRLVFGEDPANTMAFFGTYIEVVPDKRIVWTNEEGGEDGSVTTVTLEERDGVAGFGACGVAQGLVDLEPVAAFAVGLQGGLERRTVQAAFDGGHAARRQLRAGCRGQHQECPRSALRLRRPRQPCLETDCAGIRCHCGEFTSRVIRMRRGAALTAVTGTSRCDARSARTRGRRALKPGTRPGFVTTPSPESTRG
jgi:uncharacterized protein YndB with AHSA1/START domain